MRAKIEFILPEDEEAFLAAQKGSDYLCLIEEIDRHCRDQIRHVELTEGASDAYQIIRHLISESGLT